MHHLHMRAAALVVFCMPHDLTFRELGAVQKTILITACSNSEAVDAAGILNSTEWFKLPADHQPVSGITFYGSKHVPVCMAVPTDGRALNGLSAQEALDVAAQYIELMRSKALPSHMERTAKAVEGRGQWQRKHPGQPNRLGFCIMFVPRYPGAGAQAQQVSEP